MKIIEIFCDKFKPKEQIIFLLSHVSEVCLTGLSGRVKLAALGLCCCSWTFFL